uniref:RUN domain-containing protein n=1 Tax=Haemonchus placei TaxID=6290 RepID=A0A0N4W9U8_HAEPC
LMEGHLASLRDQDLMVQDLLKLILSGFHCFQKVKYSQLNARSRSRLGIALPIWLSEHFLSQMTPHFGLLEYQTPWSSKSAPSECPTWLQTCHDGISPEFAVSCASLTAHRDL